MVETIFRVRGSAPARENVKRGEITLKLGFIGIGHMGSAVLLGACRSGCVPPSDIAVYDHFRPAMDAAKDKMPDLVLVDSPHDLVRFADVILLAVKPYQIQTLLRELGDELRDKAVISIAAGVATRTLRDCADGVCRFLRVMPNMPALVSEGVTMLSKASDFLPHEREFAETLFAGVGRVHWIEENLIDAGTAVSGSSPAYAFMFIEALADGGVREGLPRSLAMELAAQALLGAARMSLETGQHPGQLKDNVCSPGGSTIEAVAALERGGFRAALIDAVRVCKQKCDDMANAACQNNDRNL